MKLLRRALALALFYSPSPAKYGAPTRSPFLLRPSSSRSSFYSTSITISSLKSPNFRTPKPRRSDAWELNPKVEGGSEEEPEPSAWENSEGSKVDWPRPSEIPWQVKVANSVKLIGTVREPVQFHAGSDGKHHARTVISQDLAPDAPSLRIPIIFEGDLAHIAACHLREKDCIYIVGRLNADSQLSAATNSQIDILVVAESINFVEQSLLANEGAAPPSRKEQIAHSISDGPRKIDKATLSSWRELIQNPKLWTDFRNNKQKGLVHPNHPDFKNKDGKALWLNTAPDWALSGLEGLVFDVQANVPKQTNKSKDDLWKSLVENPEKWWDNRSTKFSEKAPDFKSKDNAEDALWLSYAPSWVHSKLPPPVNSKPVRGKSKSAAAKNPSDGAKMGEPLL